MPSCRRAITPFNPTLLAASPAAAAGDPTALSQIDGLVNLQALMISYVDDFKLMMIVTLCAIPLAFLLRKPKAAPRCGGARRRAHGLISWHRSAGDPQVRQLVGDFLELASRLLSGGCCREGARCRRR